MRRWAAEGKVIPAGRIVAVGVFVAATFSPVKGELRIHLIDGLRPAKLVAGSFAGFVNAALADSAEIYPDDGDAG